MKSESIQQKEHKIQQKQQKKERKAQRLERRLQRKVNRKLKRKVKIKFSVFAGILLPLCFCSVIARAESGDITVQLPKDVDSKVLFSKVATMYNGEWKLDEDFKNCKVDLNAIDNAGQLNEVAGKLESYAHENQIEMSVCSDKNPNQDVYLEILEAGLYLVIMEDNDRIMMSPTLVSLPSWTGEEMSYDVTVIPKMTMIPEVTEKYSSPKTGWNSREGLYARVAGSAVFILVLWFVNKRRNVLSLKRSIMTLWNDKK